MRRLSAKEKEFGGQVLTLRLDDEDSLNIVAPDGTLMIEVDYRGPEGMADIRIFDSTGQYHSLLNINCDALGWPNSEGQQ
jgi:hypothetical protein